MNTSDMKYISYDKKLGSYRVRVPGTGQITRKSLENAIKERDLRLTMVANGKINIDSSITFKEWFDIWLERYCTSTNQRTKEGYEDDIGRSCNCLYNRKMLDIKPYQITNILLDMAKRNLAYSTIRRTKAILCNVFNSIRDNGFIDYNRIPTDGVRLPPRTATKYVSKPRRAFNTKHLESLVEASHNFSNNSKTCKTYTAALLILTRTGLRLSELLGLCKEDIVFVNDEEMTISINRSVHTVKKKTKEGYYWMIGPTKSDNSRRTLLIKDRRCVDYTRFMCTRAKKTIVYDGQEYNFVFATESGRPISHNNFFRNFGKIRRVIGSDIRIHEIRHSIATLMANNTSISYNNAAAFMGHSLTVFMQYYVHTGDDVLNSCSTAISTAYNGN